jgi:hypothetical protein
MKISLLVPTRQRRENFIRFYESALETATNPKNIEVVGYVDEDDDSYDRLELPQLTLVHGPRVVLSEAWNKCWDNATGEIFGHMGDDIVFRTKGWDVDVTEAIKARPGYIAFVWCNDVSPESQRHEFGTHGFVHKNWTNITNRFVPPYFASDYNDTWFNDVARILNVTTYIHHQITEHMHYSLGKSEIDQNTQDRLDRHAATHPEEIYNRPEMQAERQAEVEKLREFINAQA